MSDFKENIVTHYHARLATAYTRGRLGNQFQPAAVAKKPLDDLTPDECERLFQIGLDAGLKLHRFKRSTTLPRIQKALGILKSMYPLSLLDIGTGRGVFLWPLLEAFPRLPVTCIDLLHHRVADIEAVARGGIDTLRALRGDAAFLPFKDRSFDGICLLETLEHVPDPARVVGEVCRVAERFVLVSVPSKPDNNPGHLHLFDADRLRTLFNAAGGFETKIDYVLNHIIALAIRT